MTAAERNKEARRVRLIAKAGKVEGFKATTWEGNTADPQEPRKLYVNYECEKCSFTTIFKFKAEEHTKAGSHVWARPAKRKRKIRTDKGAVY